MHLQINNDGDFAALYHRQNYICASRRKETEETTLGGWDFRPFPAHQPQYGVKCTHRVGFVAQATVPVITLHAEILTGLRVLYLFHAA